MEIKVKIKNKVAFINIVDIEENMRYYFIVEISLGGGMGDAADSKSASFSGVRVRVPSQAPTYK